MPQVKRGRKSALSISSGVRCACLLPDRDRVLSEKLSWPLKIAFARRLVPWVEVKGSSEFRQVLSRCHRPLWHVEPAVGHAGIGEADRVAGVQAVPPLPWSRAFSLDSPCPTLPSPSRCPGPGRNTPSPPPCTSSPWRISCSPTRGDGPPIARSTACASLLTATASTPRSP